MSALTEVELAIALERAWQEGGQPSFIVTTPIGYAMHTEFVEHGHTRKTEAALKGIEEAEHLLAEQYRFRKLNSPKP